MAYIVIPTPHGQPPAFQAVISSLDKLVKIPLIKNPVEAVTVGVWGAAQALITSANVYSYWLIVKFQVCARNYETAPEDEKRGWCPIVKWSADKYSRPTAFVDEQGEASYRIGIHSTPEEIEEAAFQIQKDYHETLNGLSIDPKDSWGFSGTLPPQKK